MHHPHRYVLFQFTNVLKSEQNEIMRFPRGLCSVPRQSLCSGRVWFAKRGGCSVICILGYGTDFYSRGNPQGRGHCVVLSETSQVFHNLIPIYPVRTSPHSLSRPDSAVQSNYLCAFSFAMLSYPTPSVILFLHMKTFSSISTQQNSVYIRTCVNSFLSIKALRESQAERNAPFSELPKHQTNLFCDYIGYRNPTVGMN